MTISRVLTLWLAATIVFSGASYSYAAPIELVPRATGVAVGKLQGIETRDGNVTVTINFVTTAAGVTPSGVVDFVVGKPSVSEVDSRTIGMTFLAFFSKTKDGDWQLLVDPVNPQLLHHSFLPVYRGLPFEEWVPDNRIALRAELVRYLLWATSHRPESGGSFGLLLELLSGPPIESDAVQHELFSLSKSPNPKLRSMAVACLFHARDPRGLEELLLAVSNKETAFLDEGLIAYSLRKLDPTQTGLAGILKQLLNSDSMSFRRAVARELARIHSADAVTTLAALLDDPDAEIVASAVGGLAMFANGVPPGKLQPSPEPAPYRTEETIAYSVMSAEAISARRSYYVNFWKSWWQQNSAKILEE